MYLLPALFSQLALTKSSKDSNILAGLSKNDIRRNQFPASLHPSYF